MLSTLQEVRGTAALLSSLSDGRIFSWQKDTIAKSAATHLTYTTYLGGWGESRLVPLRKPITTNPIMSLKCEVGAVNGLCCHFSKWPSYGSFSLAVGDRQLLSQQEKDELVCDDSICVCVCVLVCGCGFMNERCGQGSSQNQEEPQLEQRILWQTCLWSLWRTD